MSEPAAKRMTVAEFLDWAPTQATGNFELLRGEVVSMAPERAEHSRVKFRITRALADAISRNGLPCEAFVDGLGVAIDEFTVYEPDAIVNCGEAVARDSLLAPTPAVIVELISPSSRSLDTNARLSDYFRVASVLHYLVIDCTRRLVVHDRRQDSGIAVTFDREGAIALDPPGLAIDLADIFP